MQYALLSYARSHNLGDEIQSLAAAQFLPHIDGYVDRDDWSTALDTSNETVVIMQGWFTYAPDSWPPPPWLVPVFVGFHLTDWHDNAMRLLARPEVVAYLKAHEPIGCRDEETIRLLGSAGVEGHYTGCLTTSFPTRDHEPEAGERFLVDTRGLALPTSVRVGSVRLSHAVPRFYSSEAKRILAADLLRTYRERATTVVTTRLHCALPCSAMGIPTILLGNPEDPRLMPATEILEVVPYNSSRSLRSTRGKIERRIARRRLDRTVDWSPQGADLSEQRARVGAAVRERLEAIGT